MKTAIVCSSKYGTTKKVAVLIAEKITSDNDVVFMSLSDNPKPDLSPFEKVILGTSVYAGKPRKDMVKFCRQYQSVLESKVIGLFVCGMQWKNKEQELKDAFPEYLHNIAKAEVFVGGELLLEEMNFFERALIKKMVKTDKSVSKLDYEAIDSFSEKMN